MVKRSKSRNIEPSKISARVSKKRKAAFWKSKRGQSIKAYWREKADWSRLETYD